MRLELHINKQNNCELICSTTGEVVQRFTIREIVNVDWPIATRDEPVVLVGNCEKVPLSELIKTWEDWQACETH